MWSYRRAPIDHGTPDWCPAWIRFELSLLSRLSIAYLVLFVFGVSMSVASLGCNVSARQIQAQTANAVASGANASLPLLVEQYRQQGTKAVAKAENRAEAEAAIAKVKADWEPIWKAWETMVVAEDAWATALEKGGDTTAALGALKKAYCGLKAVWPKEVPVIPLAPIQCTEGKAEPAPAPATSAGDP